MSAHRGIAATKNHYIKACHPEPAQPLTYVLLTDNPWAGVRIPSLQTSGGPRAIVEAAPPPLIHMSTATHKEKEPKRNCDYYGSSFILRPDQNRSYKGSVNCQPSVAPGPHRSLCTHHDPQTPKNILATTRQPSRAGSYAGSTSHHDEPR